LFGLFLLPLVTPAAAGSTLPTRAAAGAAATVAAPPPPSALPARPSLRLAWSDRAPHAGVPAGLDIQALDKDGNPDGSRSATVPLLVDAPRAEVSRAAGQPPLAAIPATLSQRVNVALSSGRAHVVIGFTTPGRHRILGILQADTDVSGESDPLVVLPT